MGKATSQGFNKLFTEGYIKEYKYIESKPPLQLHWGLVGHSWKFRSAAVTFMRQSDGSSAPVILRT